MATAASVSVLPSNELKKAKRKSYAKELKLFVVKYYRENNLYQTTKRFSLNTKTILRWAAEEEKLKKAKKGSKRAITTRKAAFPEMEAELYQEYKSLRKRGLKVKGFWFKTTGKQLLEQLDPEASFLFSDGWFDGFKQRHRISFRRPTNVSQRPANDKESAVRTFYKNICQATLQGEQTGKVGTFGLHQVANVDQTPLPFCFADTGDKTVWVRGGGSGLEKRPCTAQITLFADGKARVKPLLIFRGKGKRISFREKVCH